MREREWPTVYHQCLQCGKEITDRNDKKWVMVKVGAHVTNMPFHTTCSTVPPDEQSVS